MVLSDLVTDVTDAVRVYGVQPATATTALTKALIGRTMREFGDRVRPWYSDRLVLTPTASTSVYNVGVASATVTAPAMASSQVAIIAVERVCLEGTWLLDYEDRPGLVSLDEMLAFYPDYLNTTTYPAGVPIRAWTMGDTTLVLWPAPSAGSFDGGNNFMAAYHHHPEIISSSADGTVIYMTDEMRQIFIRFAVTRFLQDYASGEQLQAVMRLREEIENFELPALRAKTRNKRIIPNRRAGRSSFVHLG